MCLPHELLRSNISFQIEFGTAQGSQFENLSQNTLDMPYDTTQGWKVCFGAWKRAQFRFSCSFFAQQNWILIPQSMLLDCPGIAHVFSIPVASYRPWTSSSTEIKTRSWPGTQEGTQDEQRSGLSQEHFLQVQLAAPRIYWLFCVTTQLPQASEL